MIGNMTNYIPHRGRMILIDKIINKDEKDFSVEVNTSSSSLLANDRGVPSYCIVEYMAQSIAAYNTLYFSEDKRSRIGFMVSIRNLINQLDFIPLNISLIIKVLPVLIVSNSGTFNCMAYIKDNEIASARITAYVPTNIELERFKDYGREYN